MTEHNAVRPFSTINEKDLHSAIKRWYSEPGDRFEEPVDGSCIDIVRGDLLIEIQTGNFSAIKRKLHKLVGKHPVRLVYPVPFEKWIVRLCGETGEILGRRKSPRRGYLEDLFKELVYIPHLLKEPGFSIEVLMTREEETRCRDGSARAWRRKGWVVRERRLLEVVAKHVFETPGDLLDLYTGRLPEQFTTADLAHAAGRPRYVGQRMAYCLRAMDVITLAGKKGNALVYERSS